MVKIIAHVTHCILRFYMKSLTPIA